MGNRLPTEWLTLTSARSSTGIFDQTLVLEDIIRSFWPNIRKTLSEAFDQTCYKQCYMFIWFYSRLWSALQFVYCIPGGLTHAKIYFRRSRKKAMIYCNNQCVITHCRSSNQHLLLGGLPYLNKWLLNRFLEKPEISRFPFVPVGENEFTVEQLFGEGLNWAFEFCVPPI